MTIEYDEGSGIPDGYGDKEWHLNGRLHRIGGPAIIWKSGITKWYLHGDVHRIDGPAVEYLNNDNGYKWWYLNGKYIAFRIENPIIRKNIEILNPRTPNDIDIGIVLRHVEGVFWEVLLGNKKILAHSC